MIDPITEAWTFRLVMAFLEEDTTGSIDSVSRILMEVDSDGALDIIMTLLRFLGHEIDYGGHRDAWLEYIAHRLVGPVNSVPDIIDFGP
jgi:hypothetical protein